MNRKEIVFTIDKKGAVISTIKGIKGSSCKSIAQAFESLGKVIQKTCTQDYYEGETISACVLGVNGTDKKSR